MTCGGNLMRPLRSTRSIGSGSRVMLVILTMNAATNLPGSKFKRFVGSIHLRNWAPSVKPSSPVEIRSEIKGVCSDRSARCLRGLELHQLRTVSPKHNCQLVKAPRISEAGAYFCLGAARFSLFFESKVTILESLISSFPFWLPITL